MKEKIRMENVLFRLTEDQAKKVRIITAQMSIRKGKRFTSSMTMEELLDAYRERYRENTNEN
jgi:hypothetical protein